MTPEMFAAFWEEQKRLTDPYYPPLFIVPTYMVRMAKIGLGCLYGRVTKQESERLMVHERWLLRAEA